MDIGILYYGYVISTLVWNIDFTALLMALSINQSHVENMAAIVAAEKHLLC